MYAQFEPLTTSEIFNTNCLENTITVMQSDHPPPPPSTEKKPHQTNKNIIWLIQSIRIGDE